MEFILALLLFLIMISFGILVFTSRFVLLELKNKDHILYKKILKNPHGFPEETDYGRMDIDTQFTLYKYLFLNKENIKSVVPKHQKVFKSICFIIFVLLVVQVVNILFLTEVLGT